jgi:hypothetical protein
MLEGIAVDLTGMDALQLQLQVPLCGFGRYGMVQYASLGVVGNFSARPGAYPDNNLRFRSPGKNLSLYRLGTAFHAAVFYK